MIDSAVATGCRPIRLGSLVHPRPLVLIPVHTATTTTRHRMATASAVRDYFGGFSPLWETYCADKNRCWGAVLWPVPCHPRCGSGCRAADAHGCVHGCRGTRRRRFHRPGYCRPCRRAIVTAAPPVRPVEATPRARPANRRTDTGSTGRVGPTPPTRPPAAQGREQFATQLDDRGVGG